MSDWPWFLALFVSGMIGYVFGYIMGTTSRVQVPKELQKAFYHPLTFPEKYVIGMDPAFKTYPELEKKLSVPHCSQCGAPSYWDDRDCDHMKAILIHPANKEGESPQTFAASMEKLPKEPPQSYDLPK